MPWFGLDSNSVFNQSYFGLTIAMRAVLGLPGLWDALHAKPSAAQDFTLCESRPLDPYTWNWNEAFYHPSNWRSREIYFYSRCFIKLQTNPDLLFVKQFGEHLHHLTIQCWCPLAKSELEYYCSGVTSILHVLAKKSQLKEFKVFDLLFESVWQTAGKSRIADELTTFLRSQNGLVEVNLENAACDVNLGIHLLKALGVGSGHSIQILLIQSLFASSSRQTGPLYVRSTLLHRPDFYQAMAAFTSLRILRLNYRCLTAQLLHVFSKTLSKDHFQTLVVFCCGQEDDITCHLIHDNSWQCLSRECPRLRVHLSLENVIDPRDRANIFQPSIPLQKLMVDVNGIAEMDTAWDMNSTIELIIKNYTNVLESFDLHVSRPSDAVNNYLLSHLVMMNKLHTLNFKGPLCEDSTATVINLCQLICKKQTHLKRLKLSVMCFSEMERLKLIKIEAQFLQRFMKRNISVEIMGI